MSCMGMTPLGIPSVEDKASLISALVSATTRPWVVNEELVTLLPPRDALEVASNKVTDESTVVRILFCVLRLSLCVGSRRFTLHFTSLEIIIGIGTPTHNDLRRDSLTFYLNDLKIR